MNRWTKTVSALLALLLFSGMLSSCGDTVESTVTATEAPIGIVENNEYEYEYVGGYDFAYSPYYTPIESHCSYDQLSADEQRLYDELKVNVFYAYPKFGMFAMYKTKQVIVEGAVLSEAQVRTTVKALYDDHPYICWLNRDLMAFDYLADEERGYTAVQVYSKYPPTAIQIELEAVDAEADAFFAQVPENLDDYEREKYVHDYIIGQCVYDDTTGSPRNYAEANDPDAHSVYGALVRKNAVCDAYARTMQFLLNGLGVECVGITGDVKQSTGDGLHMWNAVKLDNEWYFVDPTWDDQDDELYRYDYFNLSTELISADHEPSALLSELTDEEINGDATNKTMASNIFVPECNSTEQNYFVRECAFLTDYDGSEVKEALYRAAAEQEPYCVFCVDKDQLDFDDAMTRLFESSQYFFYYIDEVNQRLSGYSINHGKLSVHYSERFGWISVELTYD